MAAVFGGFARLPLPNGKRRAVPVHYRVSRLETVRPQVLRFWALRFRGPGARRPG